MKKLRLYVLCTILYVLAGLLVIYTVWAVSHSAKYIGDLINSGQLTFSGNEYDIVNFYMGNCAQYFIFAVLLTAAGFICTATVKSTAEQTESVSAQTGTVNEDEELDEWFEN